MFQTVMIGRPFGIRTYVHWSFWLLFIFIAVRYLPLGIGPMAMGLSLVVALYGCIVLHELGHALTARYFGIHTNDIYLLPIGGVARLDHIPENPGQELLIALAGPAVNIVIGMGLFVLLGMEAMFLPTNEVLGGATAGLAGWLQALATTNVYLALFNLLPAFPMDGGRVLRAGLAIRWPYLKATQLAAEVGKFMAVLLGLYGLATSEFLLILLAVFVYLAGQQELLMVRMRHGHGSFRPAAYGDVIDVTPRR